MTEIGAETARDNVNEVPTKNEREVKVKRKSKIAPMNGAEVEARNVIGIIGIANGKVGIIGNGIGIEEIGIRIGGK